MTTLYEARSYAISSGEVHTWGSFYTREEAEAAMVERRDRDPEWSEKYHRDWHVGEIDVTGLFEIPMEMSPRERFTLEATPVENGKGYWSYRDCTVKDEQTQEIVARWTYRYSMRPPFEPFRQGDRFYALMATDYTRTSVIDLHTGEIIATEAPEYYDEAKTKTGAGFCPVGFYAPDWWDIHDGSIKPGTRFWNKDMEKPDGTYAFVWGCYWGDDSSWKVQYLDLSKISEGKVLRDDRFGYVELATISPKAEDFIRIYDEQVTFAVWHTYGLNGEDLTKKWRDG